MRGGVKIGAIALFTLLVLATAGAAIWFVVHEYSFSPASARLVYGDLERFAAAAEIGGGDTAEIMRTHYLDNATRGLDHYRELYDLTGSSLVRSMNEYPDAYDDPRDIVRRVRAEQPRVREALQNFEDLYPPAIHPPTWYLVGDRRAGGANGSVGIMIAAEVFADRPGELPCIVTHELTHFNHAARSPVAYAREWNNLARAIKEGAADFMAELAAGCHTNPGVHVRALEQEAELWSEFREVLRSNDTGDWFWMIPSDPERPENLGYFLGYRIVRSFYERQNDKNDAIRRIMTISDFEQFLADSGYEQLHHAPD